MAPLSKKETAELRKMDRVQMAGGASRKQLLRDMDLHRQHNVAFRAANGIQD